MKLYLSLDIRMCFILCVDVRYRCAVTIWACIVFFKLKKKQVKSLNRGKRQFLWWVLVGNEEQPMKNTTSL